MIARAPATVQSTPLLPSQVTALTAVTNGASPAIRPLTPAAAPWSADSSGGQRKRTRTSRAAKISAATVTETSGARLCLWRFRAGVDMNRMLPGPRTFTPGTHRQIPPMFPVVQGYAAPLLAGFFAAVSFAGFFLPRGFCACAPLAAFVVARPGFAAPAAFLAVG